MHKPELVNLPKILDPRGNLSFIQDFSQIPFKIRRAYWIYDVPGGLLRHGHAFKQATELIVALSGSFSVVITKPDGSEEIVHLNRSYFGLLVPPMTWRRLDNFSTNSVALVLSSTLYDPDDYLETFPEYLDAVSYEIHNVTDAIYNESIYNNVEDEPVSDPHMTSSIDDCRIIDLPRLRHPNGSLTVVENTPDELLHIARVFYLYDVPGDSERGGHSHYRSHEYIVAASGCFDVTLSDGIREKTFTLRRPYQALYIPPGIWRRLDNFSSGSVSLVLTTRLYTESDYQRSFPEFLRLTSNKSTI